MGKWFGKVLQLLAGLVMLWQGSVALQAESDVFCWGAWFAVLIGILVAASAVDALMEKADYARWWR